MLHKKILVLEGLSCASCADKIERAVSNIEGVQEASVDFVSKKMTLHIANKKDMDMITAEATKIAERIESGITVIDFDDYNEDEDREEFGTSKWKIASFALGAALFLLVLILKLPYPIEFGIYFTSYILVGGEILVRAFKNIIKGQIFDENFLMCIATLGAFAIQALPEGVTVMLFYQIGEFFQDAAVNNSRKSITALMDIRPDYANLIKGDLISKIAPNEVKIGDIILVKPGERIPLDGNIIAGVSSLDMSALTGESKPREVEIGDEVLSGSVNKNGILTIEVKKLFGESTVSKIIELARNASSKKAPTEKFITKFARYYTPVVVFVALGMAFMPPIIIPGANLSDWVYRALIFLVVSCPCALVISIPLGFFGGIGLASKNGILVKGGNYLEALKHVDTVVFDKTGTLTKGVFKVTKVVSTSDETEENILKYAAYAERYSSHPIAISIIKEYGKEFINNDLGQYDDIPGFGIKLKFEGKEILLGNEKLMLKEKISFQQIDVIGSAVYLAIENKYKGYLIISDEVKEDSKTTIQSLKMLGVRRIVMLTGDSFDEAESIARELGIQEFYSGLLPQDKVEKLEIINKEMKANNSKGKLLFVGDGINDAPVLSLADVGIAMGGIGSDAAIEAADVVIMNDEPSNIVRAIRIAMRTNRIVWQNIFFSFAVKGIVLILGAGGLATMWEAVFADIGVALIAILNAMRVLNTKKI
jgi:Cd2+/Zn2+-exporting ATPase